MRNEEVEIFSDGPESPILRHPKRKYPGVLIQGDSLHNLTTMADTACFAIEDGDTERALNLVNELSDILRVHLLDYRKVITEHGIPLPYQMRQT